MVYEVEEKSENTSLIIMALLLARNFSFWQYLITELTRRNIIHSVINSKLLSEKSAVFSI